MQIIYIALNIKSAREIQLQVIIINHPWLNSEHGPFLKSTKDTIVGHTILLNKQDKRFGNSFSIGAMGLSPRTEPIVTYQYIRTKSYIHMVVSDYRFSSALTRTSFRNMEQIANHIALAQWPALPDCLFLQQNIRLKSIVLDFYTTRFLWVLLHIIISIPYYLGQTHTSTILDHNDDGGFHFSRIRRN